MAPSSSPYCPHSSQTAFHVKCSVQRPSFPQDFDHFKVALHSAFKPLVKELQQRLQPVKVDVLPAPLKDAWVKVLDAFVDSAFKFSDQPLLPSQSNFAPVEELGQPVLIETIAGEIPDDFPEGVYIRNGPNPLFGGLKSARSVFGRSKHSWIEGEGMLHALYFNKQPRHRNNADGESRYKWRISYNNRHVETETFNLEKHRNRPCFLPAIVGDPPAILSAYLLNLMRFGTADKHLSNTNVFEHAGKFYSVAENHIPHEIDISNLRTLGYWNVNGAWNRPFTSHPKRVPGTGELVIIGIDPVKPFMELGVVSADGKRLLHKVDVKLQRCSLCHEIGITQRFNVIPDFPVTIDVNRLVRGGPLIEFDKESYARIGVMPHHGDSDSIRWFDVEPCCAFHIFNCFEEADEVVVRGCRARESIIPGPDNMRRPEPLRASDRGNTNKDSSVEEEDCPLFSHPYEWRLNMKTGEVKERNVTGTSPPMDFPVVNPKFAGLRHEFGYAQVVESSASSMTGTVRVKYGGLAKLRFDQPDNHGIESCPDDSGHEHGIEVEYHRLGDGVFCSGAAFVPRERGVEEDDGWLIAFVHDERADVSQVHILDCKNVTGEPVAVISLPSRVPYGFHGTYISPTLMGM